MLVVLLAAAAPARAASITLADVARAVGANGQMRPASEVRLRLGSSFDLYEFHAAVLASGTIPLTLVREELLARLPQR